MGIHKILCYLNESHTNSSNYLVCTDSLSALKSLSNSTKSSNSLIETIKFQIDQARTKGLNISFSWVPGHVGIVGNEEVDKLANESRNSRSIDESLTVEDAQKWFKTLLNREWQRSWMRSKDKLAQIIPVIPKTLEPTKLTRRQQMITTRLRTGHSKLTHDNLLTRTDQPQCEGCKTKLSILHILCECHNIRTLLNAKGIATRELKDILNNNNINKVLECLKITTFYGTL